eukprot:3665539-Prymnesium_polylepis.1
MRGPVGAGHRSNEGPHCAPGIGQCDVGTWVSFTGVTGASANRGPVGPARVATLCVCATRAMDGR